MTLDPAPADLFEPGAPIEVVETHAVVNRHGQIPEGSGEGAALGFLGGGAGSVLGGMAAGGPYGAGLGILLAPVFAVGGAAYGAVAAHPAEEVQAAKAALDRLYGDEVLLGVLAGAVVRELEKAGYPPQVACPKRPEAPESGSGATAMAVAAPGCAPARAVNRLEIRADYGFYQDGFYSPDLRFEIEVTAKVGRDAGAAPLEEFRWLYRSPEMKLFEVTRADAALLRERIRSAQERLAERIAADLVHAREPVEVTVGYYPFRAGETISFPPPEPGRVVRTPTKAMMARLAKHDAKERPSQASGRASQPDGPPERTRGS